MAVTVTSSARADLPAARFVYLRNRGTETCPDESDLRAAVFKRLGYDPFSSYAAATMFAEVTADAPGFSANLKLVDGNNSVRGDRVLKTRGACAELIEAMALTISIAIDPESATREGPPPGAPPDERAVGPLPSVSNDPAPAPEPSEAMSVPDQVAPSPREATPLALSASLGPLVSFGSAPGVAVGGALSADLHYGLLFTGIEGRVDAPSSETAKTGQVSSSLLLGSLFLGLRRGPVFVGAVGGIGSVHATSKDVAFERDVSAFTANLGLRAGLAIPLTNRLELRARLESLANLTRHRLLIDGNAQYRYPLFSANVGVVLAVRFR